MKNILKNNNGINLISLSIAVVILVIITTMLVYNAKDSSYIKELTNMYIDIADLREKISDYYINNGKIPANIKYENASKINQLETEKILGANDDKDAFYVIDLNAIDDLTLNFGQDYSEISNTNDNIYSGDLGDLYIINQNSHNIFYVNGIGVPQDNGVYKKYYTDDENIDVEKVNLRYVDGVKIPDGYTYVEGNKNDGITITKDNKRYIWQVLDKKITSISDISGTIDLKGNSEEEFLESANAYKGYYKLKEGNEVIYVELKEEWSETYDTKGTFVDEDENKVYIPEGFQISRKLGENRVNDGLVIRNAETKDEFVWIKVPENIYETTMSEVDYDNIEKDLQDYAKDYRKDGWNDEWYEGCGLTEQEYKNLKNKMLSSIYTNGGFYIGRYEAGLEKPKTNWVETETADDLASINGYPLSQKDKYPYIYISGNQAEGLAKKLVKDKYKLDENGYNTSLLFGIQWDLACKFIEATGSKKKEEILVDSANWGNYLDTEFTITRGSHTNDPSQASLWKNDDLPHLKTNSVSELLTTGATKRNSTLNIYDFAGNVNELTLEKSDETYLYCIRGGIWNTSKTAKPASERNSWNTGNNGIGFRVALY